MDEEIVDFMFSLEDVLQKANTVQDLLESGQLEASIEDLESVNDSLENQLSFLGELQTAIIAEMDNALLDFNDNDEKEVF